MVPHWSAEKWINVLSKGGGQKTWFQYCLKPTCPGRILFLRAIQGHSGKAFSGNARINLVVQDNVLLLKDFTKHVHHVGHGNELRSMVRNGLVPGGFIEHGWHGPFVLCFSLRTSTSFCVDKLLNVQYEGHHDLFSVFTGLRTSLLRGMVEKENREK